MLNNLEQYRKLRHIFYRLRCIYLMTHHDCRKYYNVNFLLLVIFNDYSECFY